MTEIHKDNCGCSECVTNRSFSKNRELLEENKKLKTELTHYTETAVIFRRLAAIYENCPNLNMEPQRSAVQELLKQGEEAIRIQVLRQKDEYIKMLQKRLSDCCDAISRIMTTCDCDSDDIYVVPEIMLRKALEIQDGE